MKIRKFFRSEKKRLLVSAIVLSLLLVINAEEKFYEPSEKVPLWKEFLEGSSDPATYFLGTFVQRMLFMFRSTQEILKLSKTTYGGFENFLLVNPSFSDPRIATMTSYTISILEPLYVTAIILLGIYIIFISGSPLGRAKAKASLIKLILSMILISVSPAILQLLLSMSNGLSQNILSLAPANFLEMHEETTANFARMTQNVGVGNVNLGVLFIMFSYLLTLGAFLSLIARYFLVIVLGILFPVSIFLFGFSLTRDIGKALLAMLFFCVFLSVSFSVTLVAVAIGENMLHSALYEFSGFGIAGTLLLIFSPIGMFYATNYLTKVLTKFSEEKFTMKFKDKISDSDIEAMLRELADKKKRLELEKLKAKKSLYRQLDEEAKKKDISLQEYIADWYGLKLVEKKESYGGAYPLVIKPIIPLAREIKKKVSKLKEITIILGLKVKPVEVELEVERDDSSKFNLNIENLTPLVLHNINLLEQELSENNMFVDYSETKFDLRAGETKTVTVTVTVMEDAKIKTFEGTLLITSQEGFKNFVEIRVNVTPKEGALPKTTEEACGCLNDIANADGEVSLEKLKENAEFYEYLKTKAEEQEKTIEQFVLDECKLKIIGKEKEEERLITPVKTIEKPEILARGKPGVKEIEKPVETEEKTQFVRYVNIMELSEDERRKIADEKAFVLAPPAPKAKPKIAKS